MIWANIIVILIALALIYGVWAGVTLLAHRRFGDRKLGCRGPQSDAYGNLRCCNNPDELCDSVKTPPKS